MFIYLLCTRGFARVLLRRFITNSSHSNFLLSIFKIREYSIQTSYTPHFRKVRGFGKRHKITLQRTNFTQKVMSYTHIFRFDMKKTNKHSFLFIILNIV